MPKKTLRDSPRASECSTSCLVAWSIASRTSAAMAARSQAPRALIAAPARSTRDQRRDHAAQQDEHDYRDHGRQVERRRPHPDRRDEAPEQVQPRVRDLRDEAQEYVERAVVGHAADVAQEDADEDQDHVDRDQRADIVRHVHARDRRDHLPTTASTASEKAARTPPVSSAASPRAVDPPGEVTRRRSASVSCPLSRSTAAVPAMASVTIRAASGGCSPFRTPASTSASTTSANHAGLQLITAMAVSI